MLVARRSPANEAAQLAVFLAAEAVLRVATEGMLSPLILFDKADGGWIA